MEQHFGHHDLRLLDVTLGVGNGLLPLLKRLDGELSCQHRIDILTVSVRFKLYIIHLSYNLFSSSMSGSIVYIHLLSSVPSVFRVSRLFGHLEENRKYLDCHDAPAPGFLLQRAGA